MTTGASVSFQRDRRSPPRHLTRTTFLASDTHRWRLRWAASLCYSQRWPFASLSEPPSAGSRGCNAVAAEFSGDGDLRRLRGRLSSLAGPGPWPAPATPVLEWFYLHFLAGVCLLAGFPSAARCLFRAACCS